jgi:hypothetical protein
MPQLPPAPLPPPELLLADPLPPVELALPLLPEEDAPLELALLPLLEPLPELPASPCDGTPTIVASPE